MGSKVQGNQSYTTRQEMEQTYMSMPGSANDHDATGKSFPSKLQFPSL
jgi:hypothetical protein